MKKWDEVNRLKQHNRRIVNARSILPPMHPNSSSQKRKPSSESSVNDKTVSTKVLIKRNVVSPLKLPSPYYLSYQSNKNKPNFLPLSSKQVKKYLPEVPKKKTVKLQKLGLDFFNNGDDEFSHNLEQVMRKYHEQQINLSPFSTQKTVKMLSPLRDYTELDKSQKQTNLILKTSSKSTQRKRSLQILNPLSKEERKKSKTNQQFHVDVAARKPKEKKQTITKKTQDDINLIHEIKGNHLVTQIKETKLLQNLKKIIGQSKQYTVINDLDKPNIQLDAVKQMYISFDSIKMTSTLLNLDVEEICNCLGWAIQKHIAFGQRQIIVPQTLKNTQQPIVQQQQPVQPVFTDHQIEQALNSVEDEEYEYPVSESKYDNQHWDDAQKSEDQEIQQYVYDEDGNEIDLQEYQNMQDLIVQYEKPKQGSLGAISEKSFETSRQPIERFDQQFRSTKVQRESSKDSDTIYYHDQNAMRSSPSIAERSLMRSPYQAQTSQQTPYTTFIKEINQLDMSLESKFDVIEQDEEEVSAEQKLLRLFQRVFDENDPFQNTVIPTVEVICNYCKNILITAKMEKEVTIISLVYIERLIIQSGFHLNALNWRYITFTSLILGSKIWDDESFENTNFAKAFPQFTTTRINELERVYLQFIDYSLYVKSSEYAKYYFILRTYAEKKKKSFTLRSLDVQTILHLQRNSTKAQKILIDNYKNPLNKSF